MRWIWIDRIVELERGKRGVAIKNVTLAEDLLHDHFPPRPHPSPAQDGQAPDGTRLRAEPVFPNPLIVEGMAQTAGILVGHANDFTERVLLAKVRNAAFTAAARPGHTLRYTATAERIDDSGASTLGVVDRIDPVTGETRPLATIELMFSHIDKAKGAVGSALELPEHNFVFTSQFMDLLAEGGHLPRGSTA